MLAAATQSATQSATDPENKPNIAVLDFAVSKSGQLNQVPDQLAWDGYTRYAGQGVVK